MNPDNRIYFICSVLNKDPLLQLQKLVSSKYNEFKSIDERKFHLTIFHYGIPKELYLEIKKYIKDLSFDSFLYKLEKTLKDTTITNTKDLSFDVQGSFLDKEIIKGDYLDEFGDKDSVCLVLRTTIPESILKIRENIFNLCEVFLKDCGIKNTKEFILKSENLKWQIEYKPHITLGFIKNNQSVLNLNKDMKEIIIELGRIEVRGL